jgi:hypothetical protein
MGQCIDGSHSFSRPTLTKGAPTRICPNRPGRAGLVIQNQSGATGFPAAVDVYLGDATVTNEAGSNPGYLLKGGQTPPAAFIDSISAGELWAVLANSAPADNTQPLVVSEVR